MGFNAPATRLLEPAFRIELPENPTDATRSSEDFAKPMNHLEDISGRWAGTCVLLMSIIWVACSFEKWKDTADQSIDHAVDHVDFTEEGSDVPGECSDSDGDGVCDESDVCPGHDDGSDSDDDTVPDGCDACPGGDDRIDSDGDTLPDLCDCDDSGIVCDANATCYNTEGGPVCVCNEGYEGDGLTCTDIDECSRGTHTCDAHATCANTPGSYECICNTGYSGDGHTCVDIDECSTGTHSCHAHATCTNTDGSYTCTCDTGYSGDGYTCTPIDHCASGTDLCDAHATCTYTGPGTYDCTCDTGYDGDGYTCTPIDHCSAGTDLCDVNATCTYTGPGTYDCTCNSGYTGDGFTCTPAPAYEYSDAFTNGTVTTSQCTAWDTWRAGLATSGYSRLTILGTFDSVGVSCTDPTSVQALADSIRTETFHTWSCDGRSWRTGYCGGSVELNAVGNLCQCPDPGYVVRPCISNTNWGGVNTDTCNGPSQTMTVRFE